MEIGNSYGVQSLWDLTRVSEVDASRRYQKVESEVTPSGDSVSISDEAKRLYSEMIHKYDHSSKNTSDEQEEQAGSGASGGAGGSGLSESSNSAESIKKQIESLKGQLAALASQAGNGNASVTAKMDALQSQIAALEAQLNEAESA